MVNKETAMRCRNMVVAAPHRATYLETLVLKDRGPTLRFNIGPGYRRLPNGRTEQMNDILHMYTPRY
jgi:hypothetical protein